MATNWPGTENVGGSKLQYTESGLMVHNPDWPYTLRNVKLQRD